MNHLFISKNKLITNLSIGFITVWYTGIKVFLQGGSSGYITSFLILGVLFIYVCFHMLKDIFNSKLEKMSLYFLLLLLFSFVLEMLLLNSWSRFSYSLQFYTGFYAAYILVNNYQIDPKTLRNSIVYGLGITLVISLATGVVPSSLIAYSGDDWRVHIGGNHYSAKLAVFVFIISCIHYFERKGKFNMFFIFLSLYFIVFSQARTELAATLLAMTLIFLIYKLKYNNKLVLFILPLIFLLLFYLSPLILNNIVVTGYLGDALKINTQHTGDITAGREWLWRYHYSLFNDYLLTGAPTECVDIYKNDITCSGDTARAGTESHFTKLLASEGLWGIIKLFLYVYLLYMSIKKGRWAAYVFWSGTLILVAGLSVTGSMYHYASLLALLIYHSLMYESSEQRKLYPLLWIIRNPKKQGGRL
jgi:hypothetical protein